MRRWTRHGGCPWGLAAHSPSLPKTPDRQTYIGIAFRDEFRPQAPCSWECWLSHLNLPLAQGSQGTLHTPLPHWGEKEAVGLRGGKVFCSLLLNRWHHFRYRNRIKVGATGLHGLTLSIWAGTSQPLKSQDSIFNIRQFVNNRSGSPDKKN